uniref:ATPase AAA-type core domain-containing protein n=1 Tax=viral metagenome TaxID=1070528 RepID=A0A6C0JAT2_9ZZZZ
MSGYIKRITNITYNPEKQYESDASYCSESEASDSGSILSESDTETIDISGKSIHDNSPHDNIRKDINTYITNPIQKTHCMQLVDEHERDPNSNQSNLAILKIIISINSHSSLIDNKKYDRNELVTYLNGIWDTMQESTFGHNIVKNNIIEYVATRAMGINNQKILSLCGPPGIGKTTLIMKGLSKALGLPFCQVSLGGLRDSTFFSGSQRYWKSACQGLFADILEKYGPNCVVYLDEIDKVSSDNDIAIYGYLTHALDPLTNNNIMDQYLGIGLDLSGITFILSFNEESNISKPLLDRSNIMYLTDFNIQQKINIITDYLLPDVLKLHNIEQSLMSISPEAAKFLAEILSENEGVRRHKQILNNIVNKIIISMIGNKSSFNNLANKCSKLKIKASKKSSAPKARYDSLFNKSLNLPYIINVNDIKLVSR